MSGARYLIYADGGCHGNGKRDARALGSFAVYKLGNEPVNEALHIKLTYEQPLCHEAEFSVIPVGNGRATNNMAEAQTLRAALTWAINNNLLQNENEIHICMDSQLILSQFLGVYRCREQHLRQVYQSIYALLKKQSEAVGTDVEKLIHLHWIPGTTMKSSVIGH